MKISDLDFDLIEVLEDEANRKFMQIDWEAGKVVPLTGTPREWPQGDRTPRDYEGGDDE